MELKKTLLTCLFEAGKILRNGFGKSLDIRKKGPVDLVTKIDFAADRKITSILRKRFPDHRLLTEESEPYHGSSAFRWIIDPLDGTSNYAHGLPICCVSIGLEKDGKMILGGVYNPMNNELFLAEKGKGATLNGKRIQVSRKAKLIDSLLVTGFPYDRQGKADYYLQFLKVAIQEAQGLRRLGAAALDLSYVACGRFEAYWELNIKPWDAAAGVLIAQEAGGKVTSLDGKPLDLDGPIRVLASNGLIHGPLLSRFRKFLKNEP
jgi:myo-inositol-1(or 4)-monophosphatase